MEWKKKWQITLSYETNRLSDRHLSETYEKLLPKRKYRINSGTKNTNSIINEDNLCILKQGQLK